jgi:hypothetical protein
MSKTPVNDWAKFLLGYKLTAVDPLRTASWAYSTCSRWPSGENTVTARSYLADMIDFPLVLSLYQREMQETSEICSVASLCFVMARLNVRRRRQKIYQQIVSQRRFKPCDIYINNLATLILRSILSSIMIIRLILTINTGLRGLCSNTRIMFLINHSGFTLFRKHEYGSVRKHLSVESRLGMAKTKESTKHPV